jgi:hypothetical protein
MILAKAPPNPLQRKETILAKYTADQVREKALAILAQHPEGLSSQALQVAIYGEIKNKQSDTYRRAQQHLGFAMQALRKAQKVTKNGRMGVFTILKPGERPEPEVHDLPASTRGRPRGSKNGARNGVASTDLRSYIIRDIRQKLSELEALK